MVEDVAERRRLVALACRVLAYQGLATDVLGHVSARIGPRSLLVRCRGPYERGLLFSTPADVHRVDMDGTARLDGGYAPPNETPIHTEVMRARPEVGAVVHAHPPSVVTADLAGVALHPLVGAYNIPAMRMAYAGIPVYERGVLIRRTDLAAEMLAAMGDGPVCVLRGHGIVVTGDDVEQAVVRALNVEALARISLGVARAGGTPRDLAEADIAELPDLGSTLNERSVWRYHVARLDHAGLGLADGR